MSVIEASSAGVKDMADGSLRITFEFEPRHAAEAFALFGPRGRAVAVAALKDGKDAFVDTSPERVQKTPESEHERPKGGEWAKLAGMWCADPEFWLFLNSEERAHVHVTTADHAAWAIRDACGIKSRSELDHKPEALELFNVHFRRPFMKWMQARGIVR